MKLKSKKILKELVAADLILTGITCLLIYLFNIPWNTFDYKISDYIYKIIVEAGKGPSINDRIVYLNITDKSYNYFNSNSLNREYLSQLNNILTKLNTNYIFYDIIFPRESSTNEDIDFAKSIKKLGNVFLPVGFRLSDKSKSFNWNTNKFYNFPCKSFLKKIKTTGNGKPYYAEYALPQNNIFEEASFGTGHISAVFDDDGILRHYPLIIKIDSVFFPSISLAIFLNYNKVPFDKVKINWASNLIIPALPNSFLEKDIAIPIDIHGNTFIPFMNRWGDGKVKMLETQSLLEYFQNEKYTTSLINFFEGNFVFISDISIGSSDLGQTTIEENVPLITSHAAILNALLNNNFYSQWKTFPLIILLFPLGLLLGVSTLPKSNKFFYSTGIITIIGLVIFSYFQILNQHLFPFFTVTAGYIAIFAGVIISLNLIISKDRAFIKNAFSKYVPVSVIDKLLDNPGILKLGGEERILTILFSDIVGFTSISEIMQPNELVSLLNEYLTEMTEIVIKRGGIIDKFIGDAILAEFGAPIPMDNHAEAAVASALIMHKKLIELNSSWSKKNYPLMNCRIGINTGSVILGNMGSNQVFDYTVIGDHVNLASRLEGANKRYNTKLMISENTFLLLEEDKFRTRILDIIKVKGKIKPIKVYEVIGFKDDNISDEVMKYYTLYEKAFKHYLSRNFREAEQLLKESLNYRKSDPAALDLLRRIELISSEILDETWDGSIALQEK